MTADEEGGKSNGVDWLLKNHRNLIAAEFVLNADSGGVTTVKGKPVNVDVEASEKLYADFQVSATNPGGHSSLPVSTESPLIRMTFGRTARTSGCESVPITTASSSTTGTSRP